MNHKIAQARTPKQKHYWEQLSQEDEKRRMPNWKCVIAYKSDWCKKGTKTPKVFESINMGVDQ